MTSITFAAVNGHADEPGSVDTAQEPITSEHSPAFVLLILRFQLRFFFFRDDFFVLVASFLFPHFSQLPRQQLLELLPFFVHCWFRIQNFHRLGHENKFVHQIAVTQRIEPFLRDAIFMIFR